MILFMDGFEHYGSVDDGALSTDTDVIRAIMLDNVYANMGRSTAAGVAAVPANGARTGNVALAVPADNIYSPVRRVFPGGAKGEVFVGFALFMKNLPPTADQLFPMLLLDGSNNVIASLNVTPSGVLEARRGTGTLLGASAGPVVGASSWNHIECRVVRNSSAGVFAVRVNGETVIDLTGANTGSTDFVQWACQSLDASETYVNYIDDLVVNDTSGSYNTTWKGDLRVATLFPNEDATPSGWTKYGRDKFGTGVGDFDPDDFISFADGSGLNIGSGDWTVEGFFRFYEEPVGGSQTLCGQYDTANDQRSWRLLRDFDDGGALKLQISTDGTFSTFTTVFSWDDYAFEIGRYYHLAVSRVSGTTYLFINGRMQGAGFADANTYHNSTSPLWIGAQQAGTTGSPVGGTSAGFTLDEFRLTVGTGRYSANFTPPSAAFPRSAPGDPDFADVQLLLGFNGSITDESSAGRSVALNAGASAISTVPDAQGKYAVVDENSPLDTTYIAADFIFATGELTLTANPSATETVTLGSTTYEFVSSLSSANDVLIGADANESLQNLAAAINGGTGEGVVYGTGTVANADAGAEWLGAQQLRATAAVQGAAGNSVASTETLANGSWTGATLSGGADIPAGQEFSFSPLPIDTTAVRGIQLYHRSRKTDSGPCNIQTSFHVGASSANGTDRPITTAFSYWSDVFEEDPDTSAGLTVNSIAAGSFQIDRTA